MKTLIAIWIAVVIAAVGTFTYVNAEINKLVVDEPFTVSDVKTPYNPQKTIDSVKLQPAGTASGNFTQTYNPQQTAPASVLETATEIN